MFAAELAAVADSLERAHADIKKRPRCRMRRRMERRDETPSHDGTASERAKRYVRVSRPVPELLEVTDRLIPRKAR